MNKSIYDIIKEAMVDNQLPEGFELPKLHAEDEVVFADGALDGIMMYHMEPSEISDEDRELMIEAIKNASDHEFEIAEGLFHQLAKDTRAISMAQTLQDYIYDEHREELQPGNLYEFAIGLIELSTNIECVKYGLLLLDTLIIQNEELKNTIRTLALSDEFTLYCVHIMHKWKNGNDEIYEVAKKVYGWGRIHAVEQLRALNPRYEEIKDWILKEGINNTVSPSYSALTCWKNVNLGGILFTKPTREEFHYLGRYIDALLDEDAVPGMSTLDKRKEILLKYLEQAQNFALTGEEYEIIYHIYEYANEMDEKEVYEEAKKQLHSMNAKTVILSSVKKGLCLDLATEVGIDVKPHVLKLLKDDFKNHSYVCRYLAHDKTYRSMLLDIYRKQLPLEEMKSKPSTELGFGEEYWKENALDFLLQELREYPLEGKEFVEVALQSTPIRTRNSALTVLQHWVEKKKQPLSELSSSIYSLLNELKEIEPNEGTKKMMHKLVEGRIVFKEEPTAFSKEILDILSDAISDVGVWQWWFTQDDSIQLEFGAVQLYDDTKGEKEPHSNTIALRFSNNAFAMFLDNYDEKTNWYTQLANDEIEPLELDGYMFEFNNAKYVNEVFGKYKNKTTIKDIKDEAIVSAKYILAAEAEREKVAFVVGGDQLEVLTHSAKLSEDDIYEGAKRWGIYWRDYWDKRGTDEAYEKDYACEVTIPIKDDN